MQQNIIGLKEKIYADAKRDTFNGKRFDGNGAAKAAGCG